ncbi:uncharacterized protein LOC142240085 [Haematobia irritans]|uniref:uncharacterized protein LOC142240085 n=1 Tax=Haematobia irritans TaxID=7368 RepID=UPI003F50ABEC
MFNFISKFYIIVSAILPTPHHEASSLKCEESSRHLKFHLIKQYHRSLGDKLHVDNVDSLESCIQMANTYKGLAFNYRSYSRSSTDEDDIAPKISRDHYWEQPQLYFNCHILQCPETTEFKTLINDSTFDYYSLYEEAIFPNYVCIPQVGLFILYTTNMETFQNASLNCQKIIIESAIDKLYCGSLAHIASSRRTNALVYIMKEYNDRQIMLKLKPKINLAYVGLYYNRSRTQRFQMFNMDDESLDCFPYRAWEPGNPKMSSQFTNSSCVALTSHGTWVTVECNRKLFYFCEILTECFLN